MSSWSNQKTHEITQSDYEKQYLKNREMIKVKYKNQLIPILSLNEVIKCTLLLHDFYLKNACNYDKCLHFNAPEVSIIKVYCCLCSLAFHEVDVNKDHELFVYFFLNKPE